MDGTLWVLSELPNVLGPERWLCNKNTIQSSRVLTVDGSVYAETPMRDDVYID